MKTLWDTAWFGWWAILVAALIMLWAVGAHAQTAQQNWGPPLQQDQVIWQGVTRCGVTAYIKMSDGRMMVTWHQQGSPYAYYKVNDGEAGRIPFDGVMCALLEGYC